MTEKEEMIAQGFWIKLCQNALDGFSRQLVALRQMEYRKLERHEQKKAKQAREYIDSLMGNWITAPLPDPNTSRLSQEGLKLSLIFRQHPFKTVYGELATLPLEEVRKRLSLEDQKKLEWFQREMLARFPSIRDEIVEDLHSMGMF